MRGVALATMTAAAIRHGAAEPAGLFPFADDAGRPVFNYRLPPEPSLDDVPGAIAVGSRSADVILVEFFDYNCPFCRRAAPDLDALRETDAVLRLRLVNNPVLSAGSEQAAKVQQAVLRAFGPDKAYAFHLRMLDAHGPADAATALAVATAIGLDPKMLQAQADLPQIGAALARQRSAADALGLNATPSFAIDAIGFSGYPGPKAMVRAIAAVRRCDKLACR